MNRNTAGKPYWEMTTEELRTATREFDEEFAGDKAKPLTPAMKLRWQRAKAKRPAGRNGSPQQTILVQVDKALLDECKALAKKKRVSRDVLIARGLKALLAAERK